MPKPIYIGLILIYEENYKDNIDWQMLSDEDDDSEKVDDNGPNEKSASTTLDIIRDSLSTCSYYGHTVDIDRPIILIESNVSINERA